METNWSNAHFDTMLIHAGQAPDPVSGALTTPIYQTSTFCFDSVQDGSDKFCAAKPGYVYTRAGNPTTRALETKLAAIEGGEDCVVTSSGIGAIGAILVAFLKTGDHIVCDDTLYGGTSFVMHTNLSQLGIEVTFVDACDLSALEAAITPKTKLIYMETPTNPTMKIIDLEAVAAIGKKHSIRTVVDNTFAPPPIQFPLSHGIDLVVHSVTKYLNGHGDVIGGAIIGKAADISLISSSAVQKLCGCTPSPFNSYLVLRGMKTLSLRLKKHCENAMEIARYLEANPAVETVYYPGLESHPGHELAKKQMNGVFTGIMAFELKDNINGRSAYEAGQELVNNLKLILIAVSLGDPDTIIQHPASMTHSCVPKEEREALGITDGLIRLSVGIENAADLIADFEQSFARL
ncbi:PLP-dependent aspartate aminotransferase family protein [Oscillospiraceae bacterium MB08-C2-2]|nr:PLP-dependent aspartate aminotransferase family protein [Oscillospiraceae bacterium MB08-C2-2]